MEVYEWVLLAVWSANAVLAGVGVCWLARLAGRWYDSRHP